jgi:hypothetical protein
MCDVHLQRNRKRNEVTRLRRQERERDSQEKADAYPELVQTIQQLTRELQSARAGNNTTQPSSSSRGRPGALAPGAMPRRPAV